jgi:hypothetical protein
MSCDRCEKSRRDSAGQDTVKKFRPLLLGDGEIPQWEPCRQILLAGDTPKISIPEVVLREIAKCTDVEDARFPQMCLGIRTAAEVATHYWQRRNVDVTGPSVRRSLRPVMRAARDLRDSLANLNEGAKRILAVCLEDSEEGCLLVPNDYGGLEPITVQDCKQLVAELARASANAFGAREVRHGPGAPTGTRYYELGLLVQRLRAAIEAEGGGHVRYDRPNKSGSLVDVLGLLRRHLAKGLIPDPLPWRALEQITSRKTSKNAS